ncbi:MAG: AraC family transcriptional regulator [Oscillospiraceae bacterium]|nr:AraC family transcriptional regulator [Oscillospiraceae bacterium]
MDMPKQFTDDKVFKGTEIVQAYFHNETYEFTPAHTHNFYELNIVMSGNGTHHINNSTFYIASGDVFIVPPKIIHNYAFASETYSIFHLLFHKDFFRKYEAQLNKMVGYQILFNIDPMIRSQENLINSFLHINISKNYNLTRILSELAAIETESKNSTEQKKEYLALYVIAKICDMIEDEKSSYNDGKQYLFDLLKSVEYIHTNYGEKIELQSLYTISCMSRSSYIRYFKQLFGCPPIVYIQNYRLRQAKSLLKHTNNSLTSIANDCGFCDSAHFSRLFKQKYMMSPSHYRQMLESNKKTTTPEE